MYQKKLFILKSLYDEQRDSQLIEGIVKYIPSDITLTSIQKSNEGLQIRASSLSESSIAQFLVNLNSNKSLSDVGLSQVASSVDNNFVTTFTINAKYKTEK